MSDHKDELVHEEKPGYRKIFYLIAGACILYLLYVFFIKQPTSLEKEWPGFYASYSFIAFVILVLGAKKILRPLVYRKQEEDD